MPSAFMQAVYGSLFDSVPYVPMLRKTLVVDEEGGSVTLDFIPIHQKYLDT